MWCVWWNGVANRLVERENDTWHVVTILVYMNRMCVSESRIALRIASKRESLA
jgi:hypothetical protein